MRSIVAVTSRVRRRIRVAERVFRNGRHHFCWAGGIAYYPFISLSHSADTGCRGREIQRGGVCREKPGTADARRIQGARDTGTQEEAPDGREGKTVCLFNRKWAVGGGAVLLDSSLIPSPPIMPQDRARVDDP